MNIVDCVVKKIIKKPYKLSYGNWWRVYVLADSWGSEFKTNLTFSTKRLAESVVVGFKFQN